VRKLLVSAATALTLAALCACSSTTHKGTITGTLTMAGGLAPGTSQPVAGEVTVTYSGPDHYEAAPNTDPIAVVQVGDDGSFSVTVPPGRYDVSGRSPSFGDGTYPCDSAGLVRVTAATSVSADVVCEMK
jgi:hypothetical protein